MFRLAMIGIRVLIIRFNFFFIPLLLLFVLVTFYYNIFQPEHGVFLCSLSLSAQFNAFANEHNFCDCENKNK